MALFSGVLRKRKPSAQQLAAFLRHLGYAVEAGVPLPRAVTTAGLASGHPRLVELGRACAAAVTTGRPVHTAFEASGLFGQEYVHVIRVGEASANLPGAMEQAAEAIERRDEMSRKVRGALIYPAIVLLMACGAAYLFVSVVIPQVAGLFADSKVPLPAPTRMLLAISRFVSLYGSTLLAATLGSIGAWIAAAPEQARKRAWSTLKTRTPFIRGLHTAALSAQSARTLAMLLGAGVPMLGALQMCIAAAPSPEVADTWRMALDRLQRGGRISDVLADSPLHPLLVQAIAASEHTGNMPESVARAASALEREAMHAASTLHTALEPVLTLGTGAVLGGLLLAMYLPIVNLVNTIR